MLRVEIDSEEIQRAIRLLDGMPEKLQQVRIKANRDAGKILRTGIKRGITQTYYIRPHDVDSAIQVTEDADAVTLTVRGRRRTLQSFMMRPKTAPKKRMAPGYLQGAVRRDEMHVFRHGFVLKYHNLPVLRTGRGKYKSWEGLKILYGPSVSQMAANQEILPDVIERAQKRLLQQMRYWTGRVIRE